MLNSTRRTPARPRWTALALAALALSLGAPAVAAQQMPLALVEGSRYTRRTVDAQGAESGCQILEIGRAAVTEKVLSATLAVRPCDAGADAGAVSRTTIRCEIEDAELVMNVVALLGPEGRNLALRVTGSALLYPGPPAAPIALDDVTLQADIVRGALGFLGGKSRIDFQDRETRPAASNTRAGAYSVTETVRMRAYVLGMRIKDSRYRVEEALLPDGGFVRQVLTSADGSTVTVDRIDG